jgi:hypothetical protein
VADAARAAHVPAGRLWLDPDEMSGGVLFAETPLETDLRRSVRERVKIIMRF